MSDPPGQRRRSSLKEAATVAVQARFSKLLACAMIVAFICGILLIFMGFYVANLGGYITDIKNDIPEVVTVKSAISESGQNIVPIGDIQDDVKLGAWQGTISILLIACGIVTIVGALIGGYSGMSQNKLLVIVTLVLLLGSAGMLLFLLFIFSDSDGSFHVTAKEQLMEILHREYVLETTNNAFVFAANAIMLWFQCCGVVGVKDFGNLTFVEKPTNGPTASYGFLVSPACCKRKYFNNKATIPSPFEGIKNCAVVAYNAKDNINTMGCYGAVFNSVQNTVVVILAIFMIWNIIVLVLAILALTEVKPEEGEIPSQRASVVSERKSITPKEKRPSAAIVIKKFVPYAKVSSYAHPDISRVKSTEIW